MDGLAVAYNGDEERRSRYDMPIEAVRTANRTAAAGKPDQQQWI